MEPRNCRDALPRCRGLRNQSRLVLVREATAALMAGDDLDALRRTSASIGDSSVPGHATVSQATYDRDKAAETGRLRLLGMSLQTR